MNSSISLYLTALIVAYCSMVYELLLAQTLSALLGNSILRYSVTIGLYLFSLGMGAFFLDLRPARNPLRFLFRLELILSFIGCLAPLFTFAGDAFCQMLVAKGILGADSPVLSMLNYLQSHIWIFVIGILSGFEIPLLLQIARDTGRPQLENKILAVDYGGTLLGAVCFPLILLPFLGLTASAFLTGSLNAFAAALVLLLQFSRGGIRIPRFALCVLAVSAALFGLSRSHEVHDFIINRLFFMFHS